MSRVLILCTGNSCRGQMAEYLWNELAGGAWQAVSAGVKPAGFVHPLAKRAMAELGNAMVNAESKHLSRFADDEFDLAVTVCDQARDTCPVVPNARQTAHWAISDPSETEGDEIDRLEAYRAARDQIRDRITAFLTTGQLEYEEDRR